MNSLIVIDVQKSMEDYIDFNIVDFIDYLNQFDKILYIYDKSFNESEQDVKNWLYEYNLSEDMLNSITFVEKEYGFFREAMDNLDHKELVNIIKQMIKTDEYNYENDGLYIYLPSNLEELIYYFNMYKNSTLIGGMEGECLTEIMILLDALNINYKVNKRFIY